MAYLKAAVVVHLQRLKGFTDLMLQVPPLDEQITMIKMVKESATLVMLLARGRIAGTTIHSRVDSALIKFGLCDLFYYIWLRFFLAGTRAQ